MRRKLTGRTRTEVREKLKKLQAEADVGLKTSASYTVAKAVDDWAAEALDGLTDKTLRSHVDLLRPVTMLIGNIPLRDLTAQDVRRTLSKLAQTRSTRTMASTHNVLVRAIRHAEANDRIGRNVASLVRPPQGKTGRPSRAMTAVEAAALLVAAKDHPRLGAYVILSLTTGIRTEEARALRWDHVDLDGDPDARLPVPPSIAVWRSVRLHGDTKTEKSRRTLALPQNAVTSLCEHRKRQAECRLAAGPLWQDTGLVFTTSVGTPLDASHVRRDFRALCKKAGIEGFWAPRELRHTRATLLQVSGVAAAASFGGSGEHALPAVQRAALEQARSHGSSPTCVTWNAIIRLHQAGRSCSQFGCSRYQHDAANTTEKRSDEGRCHNLSVPRAGLFAGLEQCSLPVPCRA
jgi:integrase